MDTNGYLFLSTAQTVRIPGPHIHDADVEKSWATGNHPATGETLTRYKKPANGPSPGMQEIQKTGFGKETK
jgi:hypothetical protein